MIRLFRVSIPLNLALLVLIEALLVAGCYLVAGFIALNPLADAWLYFRYEGGALQLTLATVVVLLALYFLDLYEPRPIGRSLLMQQLCLALGLAFLVQALIGYSESVILQLPQWTMLLGSGLILLVIPLWRELFFKLIWHHLPTTNLLFLGSSPLVDEVGQYLENHPEMGFRVVGYLDREPNATGMKWLGTADSVTQVVNQVNAQAVVVSSLESGLVHDLLELRMSGVDVQQLAALYEQIHGRVWIKLLQPQQVLFSGELRPRPGLVRLQTLYSFVGALIGFILSAPIMLIVAILVRLTSKGPVLYSQERVGLNGKTFRLYKFRSMYVDAEARTGPVWAQKNDPRVTPLGRWLRKLRLDELPQFFNVLRGEMALAGPRPERPEFCKVLGEKINFYNQRHLVKPGITGWAQINYPYTDSLEGTLMKLEYDLYYVKHLAPALDAYIIFHTLKVMVLSRGGQ